MIKKILLCFAAGLTALSLGLGIFYAGEFVVSMFQTNEKVEIVETVAVEPQIVPVGDLIYPQQPVQIEPKEEENESNDEEFDPTGNYALIGDAGKGFQNYNWFRINVLDYEQDPETDRWVYKSTIPKGYMFNEAEEELKFVRLFISEKHIAFETERKNGISYRFEGNFIKEKEVEYDGDIYNANVEGVLIKLKNGKEIVRQKRYFNHFIGC